MDWGTFNLLHALEQIRGVIRALQISTVVLLAKIVRKVNLKTSTILAKTINLRCLAGSWMYLCRLIITVLKTQTKMCKDEYRWDDFNQLCPFEV